MPVLTSSPSWDKPLTFSFSLISSHLARSFSAFSLASADWALQDCTCDSYSNFHVSSEALKEDSNDSDGGDGGEVAAAGSDASSDGPDSLCEEVVNAVNNADFLVSKTALFGIKFYKTYLKHSLFIRLQGAGAIRHCRCKY